LRLRSLKLVGQYKCLKGTEVEPFCQEFASVGDFYTPLCLVGINGSGKSNLIELISDIFCYADRYFNAHYITKKDLPYDFELIYFMKFDGRDELVKLLFANSNLSAALFIDGSWQLLNDDQHLYLPDHVIAYSSGHNQSLSSVFAKNQFAFYNVIKKQSSFYKRFYALYAKLEGRNFDKDELIYEELSNILSRDYKRNPCIFADPKDYNPESNPEIPLTTIIPKLPRGLFLDHSANQLIFISLFVSANERFREFLREQLNIDRLTSFQLDFRLNEYKNYEYVKDEVRRLVDLSSDSSSFDDETFNGTLGFEINDIFYEKLDGSFASREIFYKVLQFLTHLSAKKWSPDEQITLKTCAYVRNVPHVSGGYAPIRFINTKVLLISPRVETLYDRLSDGEHQLIQTIAAMMMFQGENALFILDEPESHFNPQWRADFVALINKYINTGSSEIIVSTHSPFIVSSCKGNRVLHFTKNENREINIDQVDLETYGASFDVLLRRVFDLSILISKEPLEKIRDIKNRAHDLQAADVAQQLEEFGPSFELNYLKNSLRQDI